MAKTPFTERDTELAAFRNQNPGRLMHRAMTEFEDRVLEGFATVGFDDLSRALTDVVREIELSEAVQLTALAERCRISKQALGQHVRALEERGYVTVTPDPDDARARQVRLSDRGRALLVSATEVFAAIEADWRLRVGAARYRAFLDALEALAGPTLTSR